MEDEALTYVSMYIYIAYMPLYFAFGTLSHSIHVTDPGDLLVTQEEPLH